MANPFTTGPFNCCTCPEPPDYDPAVDDPLPTYVNLCGCPSVAVVCESEQKTATLIGFSEFSASVPPKKFLTAAQSGTITETCVDGVASQSATVQAIGSKTYNIGTGLPSGNWSFIASRITGSGTTSDTCVNNFCSILQYFFSGCKYPWSISGACPLNSSFTPSSIVDASTTRVVERNEAKACGAYSGSWTATLSTEDTEAAALARATPTDGISCSSLYQLRTTSFTFTQRTSTYTATAYNLVIGVQYEGCVRIRRREAYSGTVPSGADTAWYDVEPDTIAAFTATATEEEVATDVALPNVQGYEYEVVGAYVWPTSAGCDCPTSYVAP